MLTISTKKQSCVGYMKHTYIDKYYTSGLNWNLILYIWTYTREKTLHME